MSETQQTELSAAISWAVSSIILDMKLRSRFAEAVACHEDPEVVAAAEAWEAIIERNVLAALTPERVQ